MVGLAPTPTQYLAIVQPSTTSGMGGQTRAMARSSLRGLPCPTTEKEWLQMEARGDGPPAMAPHLEGGSLPARATVDGVG